MQIKLGISSLFLQPGKVGGAEFMLKGLLVGLTTTPDVELFLFIRPEFLSWLDDLNLRDCLTPIPTRIYGNRFISEATQIPVMAKKLKLDGLIYPNYFTPWISPHSIPIATVIHDLNYLHFSHLFSWKRKLWLGVSLQFTLANAEPTVTISEFVRSDLLNSYHLKLKRSPVVINNPILWQRFDAEVVPGHPIHQPFIL